MENTQKIVEYLAKKTDWTKAGELSDFLGVSTRQIRKYIAAINKNKKYIISSTQGYRLDSSLYKEFVMSKKNSRSEQEYRQKYIIQKLITMPAGCDIFDLAEELFVSESSIKKDLQNVKRYLKKCHVSLATNKDVVRLCGSEEYKRRLMYDFIQDYSFSPNLYEDSISLFDTNYDYHLIEKQLQKTFDHFTLNYNHFVLSNITLHLIIILSRLENGYMLEEPLTREPIVTGVFYECALALNHWIDEQYHICLNMAELTNLALLIANNIVTTKRINYDALSMHNIHKYVDQTYIDITKALLKKVEDNYYLQPFKDGFITKFTLHIQNLFFRAHNDFKVKNPLSDMIRTTYPLVYDIAVFIARELSVLYHITLNEDEIAFISFHIGSYFENNAFLKMTRVNCIFVYNDYYDFYKHTSQRIQSLFKNNISIVEAAITSDFKALLNSDIDLCILPPNASLETKTETITIGFFPDENDLNMLEQKIYAISEKKQKRELKDYILNFFQEELYVKDPGYKDGFIAVKRMSEHLFQLGYVDEGFCEELLHREKLSSTAFHDVAVPHPLTAVSTRKSFIYVAIFSKGIRWNDDKVVHFIAMIGINDNSRKIFSKFFDQLIKLLDNPIHLQKLIHTENFDEFYYALNSLFTS